MTIVAAIAAELRPLLRLAFRGRLTEKFARCMLLLPDGLKAVLQENRGQDPALEIERKSLEELRPNVVLLREGALCLQSAVRDLLQEDDRLVPPQNVVVPDLLVADDLVLLQVHANAREALRERSQSVVCILEAAALNAAQVARSHLHRTVSHTMYVLLRYSLFHHDDFFFSSFFTGVDKTNGRFK